ncbi:MAG: DSD1 family PLP-dependent enzyme [Gammaproteobacteria bacterium]|nr:DSD1 family PLP-dependent enzyme [Gammaproteobacteria bacterium]
MSSREVEPVVGLDIPARIGMSTDEIATPALIVDLDAFEANVATLRDRLSDAGVRLRAHAKTHRSVDIARYQVEHGGACGLCCQKVAEAETLVDGGIVDILVSNQVVDPARIDRLAALATRARILVCVDDANNVDALSAAAQKHGVTLECLLEIDCGAHRCGVQPGPAAVSIAGKIDAAAGLKFSGLQAYQGAAQHIRDHAERAGAITAATDLARSTVEALAAAGLHCDIVAGGGTGSYPFEAGSGVYNELQCGSYVFMDADYQRVRDADGRGLAEFSNSLFVLTAVMSVARPGFAVCDAGLKVMSAESGLPRVHGADDIEYVDISDEHGVLADPGNRLQLNDRLRLVPGHCDPTCNLHDWYVGIRGGRVECLWPVSARGRSC